MKEKQIMMEKEWAQDEVGKSIDGLVGFWSVSNLYRTRASHCADLEKKSGEFEWMRDDGGWR